MFKAILAFLLISAIVWSVMKTSPQWANYSTLRTVATAIGVSITTLIILTSLVLAF